MASRKGKQPVDLSFFDHLDELRRRLIYIAVVVIVGTAVAFVFIQDILHFITLPAKDMDLIYTTPAEAFMSQIRLSFITGIFGTLPFTIYQVLLFILPALRDTEKKALIPLVIFMILLFAMGVGFSYFVVFPFALHFFLGFETEGLSPLFTISGYISFVVSFLLAFGLVFQIPLISWFLGRLGLVSSTFLKRNRKYAVLIIAVTSSLITPPDIFSQILMVGPLVLLYEIGIILVRLTEKKRIRVEEAGGI